MLAPDVQASGASPFRDPGAAFDFRFEAPPLCWIGVGLLGVDRGCPGLLGRGRLGLIGEGCSALVGTLTL